MAHFLKRLELNGFKSFAGKTVLEFPAGITAIVGPNGSGKSNIVDAVRWLLGEREAKSLRGAKVEDLIFAGTPKRARVGQAQANLHFENQNGFFPVDFTEVVIGRQVSRDGNGQYFLNKAEILLRDLIDFLAKARLGSRGMVVITQGNSDVFIQANPPARREMIEEILGLREYQLKKKDAERRLINSRVNLEKASALIEEIAPHLRSLKRQTSRWEKREAMAEELRELENMFFGGQWRELQAGVTQVAREMEAHLATRAVLEANRRVAEKDQEKLEADEPQERLQLKQIKEQIQELLEKRGRIQKEVGKLEAQVEAEQKRQRLLGGGTLPAANVLTALLAKIRARLESAAEGNLNEMRAAVREVLTEMDVVLAVPAKKQGELQEISAFLARLSQVNTEVKKLDADIETLKSKGVELERGQEEFYEFFKRAVAQVEAAKDELERWEDKNRQQVFEKERLEMRLDELRRQILQAGRQAEEFEHIPQPVSSADVGSLEARIFKLRGDLASIGEVDDALVKEARETEERHRFLVQQVTDLEKAETDLRQLILDLREKVRVEFERAMTKINTEFNSFFTLMFGGGRAALKVSRRESLVATQNKVDEELVLAGDKQTTKTAEDTEEKDRGEGIEIEVHLPKKRLGSLDVLSGGERSLVGIAALFAMISVSPPPFLVLDEIDAALDERNARRFAEMLKNFSHKTQFIVVTHNRATMAAADVLYGVTLDEDGTSKIISLKLEPTRDELIGKK